MVFKEDGWGWRSVGGSNQGGDVGSATEKIELDASEEVEQRQSV